MFQNIQIQGLAASSALLPAMLALWAVSSAAHAEITHIDVTSRTPTFEGRQFGTVGPYEKLRGRAYGEIDPNHAGNSVMTDIRLAPRNSRGKVEYAMDFLILKPIHLARGNGKLFMEINNRGGLLFGSFNGSAGGNNPSTAADAGDAFLMNQGYAMAWSGWDVSAAPGGHRLTLTAPVATHPDGSTITGPVYEYIVADNANTQSYALSYPTASIDPQAAALTVRDRLNDPPVDVPASGWSYADERTIQLLPVGTPFKQGAIYEFAYTAKNPVVAGIGFAATRDFVSFLRKAHTDNAGNPNPLAGHAKSTYAFTVSQPARFVNDFVWLGFNEDEGGAKVFDGILNWIGAGTGVAANVRFAQTARTERNRQNHLYPEAFFPFAYDALFDAISGKTDGRAVRCDSSGTCPKILHVNSSNEYWVKAGSLLHTDLAGGSLRRSQDMRYYLLASTEHTVSGSPANSPGICAQPRNVVDPNPALRGLFVALDAWVSHRVAPPRNAIPRVESGNVAFVQPTANGVGVVNQAELGWPDIPGVLYTGLATARNQLYWGPQFDVEGVMTVNPPKATGATYRHFVSKVDRDGNEIAGIRLPPVEVPTATLTGWAHRSPAFGGPDGCEASGQTLNFAATRAQREANGDPRRSLQERYRTKDRYVNAVERAAGQLVRQRILLPEDAKRYIEAARASNLPLP